MKAAWRFGTLVLTLMLRSGVLLWQTDDSKSLAAFKNLSSLVGEWKGMQNSQEITYVLSRRRPFDCYSLL
jgi:hypothetical protein